MSNKKFILNTSKYKYVGNANKEGYSRVLLFTGNNRLWGYIDKQGKEVIPCIYNDAENFIDGVAIVTLNGKSHLINTKGETLASYDIIYNFYCGLAVVKLNDNFGYIDITGKEIVPCIYDYAYCFIDGFACVRIEDSYSLIDTTGKVITTKEYEDFIGDFYEGLTAVLYDGKWGYIDTTGKEVIPCIYAYASVFKQGTAIVILNGNDMICINKKGQTVGDYKLVV